MSLFNIDIGDKVLINKNLNNPKIVYTVVDKRESRSGVYHTGYNFKLNGHHTDTEEWYSEGCITNNLTDEAKMFNMSLLQRIIDLGYRW